MDEKLLKKMIRNCFLQYKLELDSFPLTDDDVQKLCNQIILEKQNKPHIDLYELVNDMVYDYLTK